MSAVISNFMKKLGLGPDDESDEEYTYEDEVEYEDEEEEIEEAPRRSGVRNFFNHSQSTQDYSSRSMQTKVIPMETAVSSSKMVITEPSCYESVEEIGEYLKEKKAVIINLENVSKEEARRILDFLSGAAYMIDGTIQKVSNLIYLMTPRNVEIQDDTKKDEYGSSRQQKLSFSWLNSK